MFNLLEQIRNKTGNDKIDFLKGNKNNFLLKEILYYTYNPHLKYRITKKTIEKLIKEDGENDINYNNFRKFKEILDELSKAKGIKQKDREKVAEFINYFNTDSKQILLGILFKDLRLNLGSSTINKIWENLIPDSFLGNFKVMKLHTIKELDELPFSQTVLSRKFNGINCSVFSENNKIVILGRSGKPIPENRYLNIREQIQKPHFDIENKIYLGEMVYIDNDHKDHQHKVTDENYFETKCKFVIFDILDKKMFFEQKSSYHNFFENYSKFAKQYNAYYFKYYKMYNEIYKDICLASQVEVRNQSELKRFTEIVAENQWEGLVLRNGQKPYEFKRTRNALRYKPRFDDEFEIIGFEEGKGKYENNLGNIIIKLDQDNTTKVGTGFDDQTRQMIWSKRDKILNDKTILLKTEYREKSINKKGELSLIEPSFKGFRRKHTLETISIKEI